jgi:TetR/AcrR family transcriptional regulator, transcriptional repressor for nem operon
MSSARRPMSEAPSKREAILTAAKALLWERGYEAMSPRDVMKRSGAGQGSLYHHFDGKLDLACAALAEMAAEECAAVDEIFAASKPPLARVENYLARERDALRGCRLARLANEPTMEQPQFRAAVADFLQRIEESLALALREAREAGEISPGADDKALAAMFLAIVEGGFVLARAHWDAERMRRALFGARQVLEALRK